MSDLNRRDFLKLAGGATALSLAGCATPSAAKARVVVIGGGFGGATTAKYIRMWDPAIDVVLVERNAMFTSCPMSNLVIGGNRRIDEIQRSYDGLRRRGVEVVTAEVTAVDTGKRAVTIASGRELTYDRLVVSPGIDFMYGEIEGYESAFETNRVVHAWKAGPQTIELRRQLEQMNDGGVYLLSIPLAPYRCPPGPYERACQVAHYFKTSKPRSKVLVFDANQDITSKGPLFKRAWAELYKGIIDYHPQSKAIGVDGGTMTVKFEFESVKGNVLNVVPPQRAGDVAVKAGFVTHNNRWCDVDWMTCESKAAKNVHIVGDATLSAPLMPKSGHIANSQAKVCADAIVSLINGRAPSATPVMNNTCYSYVSDKEVIHVASVHQWDAAAKTIQPVKGAGGVSSARNELEGDFAWSWAQNIWADTLG